MNVAIIKHTVKRESWSIKNFHIVSSKSKNEREVSIIYFQENLTIGFQIFKNLDEASGLLRSVIFEKKLASRLRYTRCTRSTEPSLSEKGSCSFQLWLILLYSMILSSSRIYPQAAKSTSLAISVNCYHIS